MRTSRTIRQRGFSLIELMIALLLGLILISGILTLFMSTLQSNGDLANTQQLENELHATMDLITRDLRRAGANGNPSPLPNFTNPFSLGSLGAYTNGTDIEAANSCVLFSYDMNNNGVLDTGSPNPDERFGYRLQHQVQGVAAAIGAAGAVGVVQMRSGGLSCTQDSWTNITTAAVTNVTQLQFSVTTLTDGYMSNNRVTVTLAGQLASDATVTRVLTSTVRVRNDIWVP